MTSHKKELKDTLSGIADLYGGNLGTHGATPKSVGWKDDGTQRLRFEKLASVIEPKTGGAGISVNDWGCGYAAMFQFIAEMSGVHLSQYYGYDISEEMLAAAKQFVTDSRATFVKSPQITHEADYSFVSGTFNVRLEASDELWTDYIKETLLELAAKSSRGLAFNLLTTYVDWRQDSLYYADPFLFFDFCKRNISRYASLLHDYPLYEWTIVVRKESSTG